MAKKKRPVPAVIVTYHIAPKCSQCHLILDAFWREGYPRFTHCPANDCGALLDWAAYDQLLAKLIPNSP